MRWHVVIDSRARQRSEARNPTHVMNAMMSCLLLFGWVREESMAFSIDAGETIVRSKGTCQSQAGSPS